MFSPSDKRRVQAAFEKALELPYEAQIELSADRRAMRVFVNDPDDESIPVAQAMWTYDGSKLGVTRRQPADAELELIAAQFKTACAEHAGG